MSEHRLSVLAEWRNALRDSELDLTAKAVGWCISTYAKTDGSVGPPGPAKTTIAAGVTLRSVRSVDAALARLELAGLLVVFRSRGKRSHSYLLAMPTEQRAAGLERGSRMPGSEVNPASDDAQPGISRLQTRQPAAAELEEQDLKSRARASEGDIQEDARAMLRERPSLASWLRNVGVLCAESPRDFREELGATWEISDPELVAALRAVALEGTEEPALSGERVA